MRMFRQVNEVNELNEMVANESNVYGRMSAVETSKKNVNKFLREN